MTPRPACSRTPLIRLWPGLAAFCAITLLALIPARGEESGWPQTSSQTRPWTRWWWMGSAVERDGITKALEAYRAAGFGGVEITPIYGVHGEEARFLTYLSPEWTAMLEHTLREARRLGLGVDLANTTGWPFGGPWVEDATASRCLARRTWSLEGGARLDEPVRHVQEPLGAGRRGQGGDHRAAGPGRAQRRPAASRARPGPLPEGRAAARHSSRVSENGELVDLTSRVDANRMLDWVAPAGRWRLDAVFLGWHGKMVERAAPGGEGRVIDHFSQAALRAHLGRFELAFAGRDLAGLRAFFNDSYEVDDAAGPGRRHARAASTSSASGGATTCAPQLAALFGEGDADTSARVLADYRETISDLLLERFTRPWQQWAARRGALVRNQAHGSTGQPARPLCRQRTSPRPRAATHSACAGRSRRPTSQAARSSRRRPRPGWASTSAPRSPTCARRSTTTSWPASTTSCTTER